ncbi:MAG: transposase [Pseudomonadota bacterium]
MDQHSAEASPSPLGPSPGVLEPVAPALATALTTATTATFAAWLGLVPRQMSTGGKTRLGGITKRGNTYLGRLFIHGARSFRLNGSRSRHRIGTSLDDLDARTHKTIATVALANKLARIAWSVLAGGREYDGMSAAG